MAPWCTQCGSQDFDAGECLQADAPVSCRVCGQCFALDDLLRLSNEKAGRFEAARSLGLGDAAEPAHS